MDINRVTKITLTKTGEDTIVVTENIEAGSVSIEEILFDGSLEFGVINSNKLELRLYSPLDIKGYKIQLSQGSSFVKDNQDNDTQELNDEQIMFTGYVQSCKLSGQDYYRDIVAYDELYFKKDLNIANWYSGTATNNHNDGIFGKGGTGTVTLREFRNSMCAYLGITVDSYYNNNVLTNDAKSISKTVNISSMKFSEMLKMICELQGTIPKMSRDGKLTFIYLNNYDENTTTVFKTLDITGNNDELLYESDNSTFEEFKTDKITQIIFMGEDADGNQQMSAFSDNSANPNNNPYIIENNILIKGMNDSTIKSIANGIYNQVNNLSYTPCEINMVVSNRDITLGRRLKVIVRDTSDVSNPNATKTIYCYCTSISFSGSQLVNQTITCSGEESLSDSTSSSNPEFKALADKAYPIQTSMSVDYFRAKYISTDYIQAQTANFGYLTAQTLEAELVKTDKIIAIEGKIDTLEANQITTTTLDATYAKITDIEAEYAKISTVESNYLQTDMLNAEDATFQKMFVDTGILREATIRNGYVVGVLNAVRINADVIDAGTLAVERLIIKGGKTITYTPQLSKPSDWATNYNKYYVPTAWELNTDSTYAANKFYYHNRNSQNFSNTYFLITSNSAPTDWNTNYNKHYFVATNFTLNTNSAWSSPTGYGTNAPQGVVNSYRHDNYDNPTSRVLFKQNIGYGNNSVMYKLNADHTTLDEQTISDRDLNDYLNGEVILAKSITAEQIHAGTITADEIAARTITAGKIRAGTITANEIATGTITADKIKAGSITTDCLAVGDFTNYFIVNPTNLSEYKWEKSPPAFTEVGWITPTENATYYALTDVLQLPAGTRLKLSGSMYLYDYLTGIVIYWINSAGTKFSPQYVSSGISGESQIFYDDEGSYDFNNASKNNLIKIPNYPTNAVAFQIYVYTAKSDMPKFHLRNFAIRRADGGDIIAGKIMSRDGNSYFDLDGTDANGYKSEIATNNAKITGGTIQIGDLSDASRTILKQGVIEIYAKYNNVMRKTGTIDSVALSGTSKSFMIFDVVDGSNFPGFSFGREATGGHLADVEINTQSNYNLRVNKSIETGVGFQSTNTNQIALKHHRMINNYTYTSELGIYNPAGNSPSFYLQVGNSNTTTQMDLFNYVSGNTLYNRRINLRFYSNTSGDAYTGNIQIVKGDSETFFVFEGTHGAYNIDYGGNIIGGNGVDIYAKGFQQLSTETIKTNITPATSVLQSIFENSDIYSYNYTHQEPVINLDGSESFEVDDEGNVVVDDNGDPVPEMQTVTDNETSYGFVIGDNYNTPQEVISSEGIGINLYSMASLTWKAVQELYERVKLLEGNNPQSV